MKAIRLLISGKVQGVFFRAETKKKADALGISGWVRNADDGGVEVHAEGTEDALEKLEQWCKGGPENAEVKHVEKIAVEPEGHSAFIIQF